MPLFTPNRPISYDGKIYQPDQPVEVSEEWGEKLAKKGYGVLEIPPPTPTEKPPTKHPPTSTKK